MANPKEDRNRGEATLRAGGAAPILDVLRVFEIDPAVVVKKAGIATRIFDDPDNLITYRARGRLMSQAVRATGCEHFGLLVGQRMNLQSLGLLGFLARNSSDVGTALHSIVNYLHLHARGAAMDLVIEKTLATLSYNAYEQNVEATDQTGSGAVAMMLNVMRALCSADFQPIEVRFAHRKPDDVRPFRRFFSQIPLRFDAEHYALAFSSDWLHRAVPGADPELERLLQKQINALETRHGAEFPEIVRSVLRSALLTDRAGAEHISALFGIHSRTLSRRLEYFGTSFQEIVDEVRFEIARQMLSQTSLEVGQIADAIGYTRASAFARAFRRWSGATPGEWRTQNSGVEEHVNRRRGLTSEDRGQTSTLVHTNDARRSDADRIRRSRQKLQR
jgi:AraC-like DNA-binding protein